MGYSCVTLCKELTGMLTLANTKWLLLYNSIFFETNLKPQAVGRTPHALPDPKHQKKPPVSVRRDGVAQVPYFPALSCRSVAMLSTVVGAWRVCMLWKIWKKK